MCVCRVEKSLATGLSKKEINKNQVEKKKKRQTDKPGLLGPRGFVSQSLWNISNSASSIHPLPVRRMISSSF